MTTERYRAIINEGSKRRAVEGDACRAHAALAEIAAPEVDRG